MQLDELRVSRGSALIGSFVKDLEVRGRGQVGRTYLIVALRRADGTLIMNPGSTVVLHEDDTVIVMGHRGDMPKLAEELSLKRQIRYRGAKL
jgi:voltage-gated potassium channel